MGYGTGGNGLPTTYFSIKGLKKGETEVFFEGKVKKDGRYESIEDRPTYIEGILKEVKTSSYKYEGEDIHTVKLTLEDMDGRYVIETGYSNVGINILNTLLGAEEIHKVSISVYHKDGWANAYVKVDDIDKSEWKFDYKKEIKPLIETVKFGGKLLTDKTKVIALFEKELNSKEFQDKLVNIATPAYKPQEPVDDFEKVEPEDNEPDDLPF